ncbi:MAG: hypothetical protein Q8P24_17830 [Desulfobacterales bacterium]|nr:hypothetical protein [Desulfobacterales bacterium]
MLQNLFEKKSVAMATGWLLIGTHFMLFSRLLPNEQGKLGHDYAYNLPLLLDGYYWFLNNGLFSVPWFTPSFCGGMPLLANPATFYFSAVQFLTFLFDPLTSIRLTFVLFAALGYWGFYLLLAGVFSTSRAAAILGSAIFLFNGLYAYRLVIGHLEFHAFMLVPFLAYFLLCRPAAGSVLRKWAGVAHVVMAGVLIAYMFMSGMAQLLIPSLISVALLGLLKGLTDRAGFSLCHFAIRFSVAGLLSLMLSGVKLVAALAFLENFQRASYLLPGVSELSRLLVLVGRSLALGGGGIDAKTLISNYQWNLERHEFEYGVTIVPFLLIAGAILLDPGKFSRWWRSAGRARLLGYLAAILLLLLIPLPLNFYSPAWNQFLKSLHLIKSISNFFRWFTVYIPFLALLAALVPDRTPALKPIRAMVVLVGLLLLLGQNLLTDRIFYRGDKILNYDPATIRAAYKKTSRDGKPPVIKNLVAPRTWSGKPILTINRNDVLAVGDSQLLCYEPMFGFRLEFFPFQTIHPGPALSERWGILNLKNPACYMYPMENQCEPGDHFRIEQWREAEQFLAFRPFTYQTSKLQKWANRVSLITLLAIATFAAGCLAVWARQKARPRRPGG